MELQNKEGKKCKQGSKNGTKTKRGKMAFQDIVQVRIKSMANVTQRHGQLDSTEGLIPCCRP